MDDEIKSASQIAQEKIAQMGEATEADRLRWKHVPQGEALGNKYLNEGGDLVAELKGCDDKARPYVKEGLESVLLAGIGLPQNEVAQARGERALAGLESIKQDKAALAEVVANIKNIFDHYTGQGKQQRDQTYESLKAEYGLKLQQALEQQLGSSAGLDISVETLPQFQEEWRRIEAQMDMQYIGLLDDYKKALKEIK